MKKHFSDWFQEKGTIRENLGKTGNIKPPKKENLVLMGLRAWEDIDEEIVENSFKVSIKMKNSV